MEVAKVIAVLGEHKLINYASSIKPHLQRKLITATDLSKGLVHLSAGVCSSILHILIKMNAVTLCLWSSVKVGRFAPVVDLL